MARHPGLSFPSRLESVDCRRYTLGMRLSILFVTAALLAGAEQPSFVPADFAVPAEYRTATFKFVPLGPALARQDYEAYMSSIEHLQKNFTGNTEWPNEKVTMAEAIKDVEGEKERFDARKSFTYSVLTLDGSKELGCVYLSPSKKQGYDAVVRVWVTKAQFDAGFEARLIPVVKQWLAAKWPFQKVAWPKREIPADKWAALPDKPVR